MTEEKPVWGQGAACPHKPQWHCERHGECRGCECGCDTVNPPLEELEGDDDYLGEKDLVHHPGTGEMTAAQLAAIHTRHANAIRPIPSATVLGHEHLMADADRGALLAELNRAMEEAYRLREECDGLRALLSVTAVKEGDAAAEVERLEAEVERLNLEVVQNASGAQVIMNAGMAYLQEVKRLEGVVAGLKEINDRMAEERLHLTQERDSLSRRCAAYFQEAEEMRAQIHVLKGHEVPDVNEMNRGFGNCPHCSSPRIARCHECLNEVKRDEAHEAGWRMDHLSGFGCIALCPDHR